MERKTNAMASAKETDPARTAATPVAWFEDVDRWFDRIRRSFEDRMWRAPLARLGATGLDVREPLVDLIDKGSEFVVRAELPGVSKEDVDLTVTADGIEIGARSDRSHEAKDKDYYFQERTHRSFHRALSFPEEVKADLASATLKDGVLEVRIPKREATPETKPVKVAVE